MATKGLPVDDPADPELHLAYLQTLIMPDAKYPPELDEAGEFRCTPRVAYKGGKLHQLWVRDFPSGGPRLGEWREVPADLPDDEYKAVVLTDADVKLRQGGKKKP